MVTTTIRRHSTAINIPLNFKSTLPPRKRAKTEEEKEQRRIERILRNRKAAHLSREKKRLHLKYLEEKCQIMENIFSYLDLDNLLKNKPEGFKLLKKYREEYSKPPCIKSKDEKNEMKEKSKESESIPSPASSSDIDKENSDTPSIISMDSNNMKDNLPFNFNDILQLDDSGDILQGLDNNYIDFNFMFSKNDLNINNSLNDDIFTFNNNDVSFDINDWRNPAVITPINIIILKLIVFISN